jgi:hypothetical protein
MQSSSQFTAVRSASRAHEALEARELALGSRIELIDGQSIIDWLRWMNPPDTAQGSETTHEPRARGAGADRLRSKRGSRHNRPVTAHTR